MAKKTANRKNQPKHGDAMTVTDVTANNGFWNKVRPQRSYAGHQTIIQHKVTRGGGIRGQKLEFFLTLNISQTEIDQDLLRSRRIRVENAEASTSRPVHESEVKRWISKSKKGDRTILLLGDNIAFGQEGIMHAAFPTVFPSARVNKQQENKGGINPPAPQTVQTEVETIQPPRQEQPERKEIDMSQLNITHISRILDAKKIRELMESKKVFSLLDPDGMGMNKGQVVISSALLNGGLKGSQRYTLDFSSDSHVKMFLSRLNGKKSGDVWIVGSTDRTLPNESGEMLVIGSWDVLKGQLKNHGVSEDDLMAWNSGTQNILGIEQNSDAAAEPETDLDDDDNESDVPAVTYTGPKISAENTITWSAFYSKPTALANGLSQRDQNHQFGAIEFRDRITHERTTFAVYISADLYEELGLADSEVKLMRMSLTQMLTNPTGLKRQIEKGLAIGVGKGRGDDISMVAFLADKMPEKLAQHIETLNEVEGVYVPDVSAQKQAAATKTRGKPEPAAIEKPSLKDVIRAATGETVDLKDYAEELSALFEGEIFDWAAIRTNAPVVKEKLRQQGGAGLVKFRQAVSRMVVSVAQLHTWELIDSIKAKTYSVAELNSAAKKVQENMSGGEPVRVTLNGQPAYTVFSLSHVPLKLAECITGISEEQPQAEETVELEEEQEAASGETQDHSQEILESEESATDPVEDIVEIAEEDDVTEEPATASFSKAAAAGKRLSILGLEFVAAGNVVSRTAEPDDTAEETESLWVDLLSEWQSAQEKTQDAPHVLELKSGKGETVAFMTGNAEIMAAMNSSISTAQEINPRSPVVVSYEYVPSSGIDPDASDAESSMVTSLKRAFDLIKGDQIPRSIVVVDEATCMPVAMMVSKSVYDATKGMAHRILG